MTTGIFIKKYHIESICWWIINLILVFTFLFKQFTFLSNIALLVLLICRYKTLQYSHKRSIILCGLFVLFLSSYSIILHNNISNIIRFSIILFFICAAYFLKLPKRILIPPLRFSALALSIILILGEFYMIFFFDRSNSALLRNFLISNGLGDIYPKYGFFYAIQLVGTAALPFIFMLSFIENSLFKNNKWFCRILLFSGVIIAGNFGFLVAIFFFLFCIYSSVKTTYRSLLNKIIILSVFFIMAGPYIFNFVSKTLESKKEESNAIRIDQASVLMNDMSSNVGTLIFGTGVGHTLDVKTRFRDYTDNVYYELQSLYFLNQMGILFFLLFILINIYFAFKYIAFPKLLLLYLSYILYAITNPYILNTNQVVVIITLASLCYSYKKNNEPADQLSLHI